VTRRRLGIGDDECVFVYAGAIGVANASTCCSTRSQKVPGDVRVRVVVAGDGSARAQIEEALRGGPSSA